MKCGDCGNTSPALSGFPKHVFCHYYLLHMSNIADASRCENFEPKLKTNADRIRTMTDEELAEYLKDHNFNCPPCDCPGEDECSDCWLDWLKSPVEMDE